MRGDAPAAADPLEPEAQIEALADLCRQLTRRLGYLSARLTDSPNAPVKNLAVRA